MRQAEKKKEKDKIAIVLMLCFCVIALTSIFTIRSNFNKIQESQPGLPVSENTETDSPQDGLQKPEADSSSKKESGISDVSAPVPTVDSRQDEDDSAVPASPAYIYPVKADTTSLAAEFAMDHLVYSVTLDQYMVHSGIDIEAPADSQVLSIASGTVTAVYRDDRYGNSVEVTHDNGLISIYSNLSDAAMVETGDTVSAGQILGGVGTTGLFESLQPAHLHLEIIKDGVYMDPMELLS